jgi:hypothetical protein
MDSGETAYMRGLFQALIFRPLMLNLINSCSTKHHHGQQRRDEEIVDIR